MFDYGVINLEIKRNFGFLVVKGERERRILVRLV